MRGLIPLSCALAAVVVLSCKGGGDDDPGAGGAGGAGGSDAGVGGSAGGPGGAGGTAGTGGVGGTTSTDCDPGMMRDCYSGPPSTANVGDCTVGSETCNEAGSDWGECIGEVLPATEVPTEPGQQEADEDCDGMVDEPPGS